VLAYFISAALIRQGFAKTSAQELVFSVELQDPIVHHLRFSSSVTIGERFRFEANSGEAKCTISGTVAAPVNGVFSFPIAIEESRGADMTMKGDQSVALSLNKPYSAGPSASFVYMRTFTLAESPGN
jgi:hypothetical protein